MQAVYRIGKKYAVTGDDWYVFVPKDIYGKPAKRNGKEWYQAGYEALPGEWVKATKLSKRDIKKLPLAYKFVTKGWKAGDGTNYIWSKDYKKTEIKMINGRPVTICKKVAPKVFFRNKKPAVTNSAFKLTLVANNGTDKVKVENLAAGQTYKLDNPNFTNKGKTLVGWSKTKDGKKQYTVGEEFKMPNGDAKLYAVWQKSNEGNNFFIAGDETYKVFIDGSDAKIEGLPLKKDFDFSKNYTEVHGYDYKPGFTKDTLIAIRGQDFDGKSNVAGIKAMYKTKDGKFKGTDSTWWIHVGDPQPYVAKGHVYEWFEAGYKADDWKQVALITDEKIDKGHGIFWDRTNWPSKEAGIEFVWTKNFMYVEKDATGKEIKIDTPVYIRNLKPTGKEPDIDGTTEQGTFNLIKTWEGKAPGIKSVTFKLKYKAEDGRFVDYDDSVYINSNMDWKTSAKIKVGEYKISENPVDNYQAVFENGKTEYQFTISKDKTTEVKVKNYKVVVPVDPTDDVKDGYVRIKFEAGAHGKIEPAEGYKTVVFDVLKGVDYKEVQKIIPKTIAEDEYEFIDWKPKFPATGKVEKGGKYIAEFSKEPNPDPEHGTGGLTIKIDSNADYAKVATVNIYKVSKDGKKSILIKKDEQIQLEDLRSGEKTLDLKYGKYIVQEQTEEGFTARYIKQKFEINKNQVDAEVKIMNLKHIIPIDPNPDTNKLYSKVDFVVEGKGGVLKPSDKGKALSFYVYKNTPFAELKEKVPLPAADKGYEFDKWSPVLPKDTFKFEFKADGYKYAAKFKKTTGPIPELDCTIKINKVTKHGKFEDNVFFKVVNLDHDIVKGVQFDLTDGKGSAEIKAAIGENEISERPVEGFTPIFSANKVTFTMKKKTAEITVKNMKNVVPFDDKKVDEFKDDYVVMTFKAGEHGKLVNRDGKDGAEFKFFVLRGIEFGKLNKDIPTAVGVADANDFYKFDKWTPVLPDNDKIVKADAVYTAEFKKDKVDPQPDTEGTIKLSKTTNVKTTVDKVTFKLVDVDLKKVVATAEMKLDNGKGEAELKAPVGEYTIVETGMPEFKAIFTVDNTALDQNKIRIKKDLEEIKVDVINKVKIIPIVDEDKDKKPSDPTDDKKADDMYHKVSFVAGSHGKLVAKKDVKATSFFVLDATSFDELKKVMPTPVADSGYSFKNNWSPKLPNEVISDGTYKAEFVEKSSNPDPDPDPDPEPNPDPNPDPKPDPSDEVVIDDDDTPSDKLDYKNHHAYINGYVDNTVRPNGLLTREETAAVFYRLLDKVYREKIRTTSNSFSDISVNRWSNKHISTLANGNIIKGGPDGRFRPAAYITRAELATIASRFEDLEDVSENKFSDIDGHWAEKYIKSAAAKGWIKGYPDGTFGPDKKITRAEFVTLVNNVLNRHVKKADLLDGLQSYVDLNDEGKWYYTAMRIATNSYKYEDLGNGYQKWLELIYPKIEM